MNLHVSRVSISTEDPIEVHELNTLLDQERNATVRADVDALIVLQHQKRTALDSILGKSIRDELLDELSRKAQSNIALMRHLVQCLRGPIAHSDAELYTASGGRASEPVGRSHGAL